MGLLQEGLNYRDMVGQVTPRLGVDEFQSQIGEDSDIIVLNFIVNGQEVGKDLVNWLERGYDWIIDAEISPGEVLDRKFYVFAELNRRTSAPRRIMELLQDLETLTAIKADDWKISVAGSKFPASIEALQDNVALTPAQYKQGRDSDLNEWREIAGLPVQSLQSDSEDLAEFRRIAGLR